MGERGVARIEENEIPGAKRVAPYRPSPASDVGSAAAKFEPRRLVEDVGNHTAAVEASFRVLAAKTITGIDQAESVQGNLKTLPGNLGTLSCGYGRSFRCRCKAAAGDQEKGQRKGDDR